MSSSVIVARSGFSTVTESTSSTAGGAVAGASPVRLNGPVTPPTVPPIRPAPIATSLYCAIALSSSKGKPACSLSRTCCPISVGISVAAPWTKPLDARENMPPLELANLPTSNLSPITLSAACPPADKNASHKSTSSFRPDATSDRCNSTLRPKNNGSAVAAPAAKPPTGPPAAVPTSIEPIVAVISGAVCPPTSPNAVKNSPTPSASENEVFCGKFTFSRICSARACPCILAPRPANPSNPVT